MKPHSWSTPALRHGNWEAGGVSACWPVCWDRLRPFPGFPEFPEFSEVRKFPEFPEFLNFLNFLNSWRGRGLTTLNDWPIGGEAAPARLLIGPDSYSCGQGPCLVVCLFHLAVSCLWMDYRPSQDQTKPPHKYLPKVTFDIRVTNQNPKILRSK